MNEIMPYEVDGLLRVPMPCVATDDQLKRCWDEWDGMQAKTNAEGCYMELNRRGLGKYCAV